MAPAQFPPVSFPGSSPQEDEDIFGLKWWPYISLLTRERRIMMELPLTPFRSSPLLLPEAGAVWAALAVQGISVSTEDPLPLQPLPYISPPIPASPGNLPQMVWGVTSSSSVSKLLWPDTLCTVTVSGHTSPGRKADRPGLADKNNGSVEPEHSSLPCSGKAGGERKIINADSLCFPKPAFLTNSCVYTKLEKKEREKEEKGQCRRDDIILCCLLWLAPTPGVWGGGDCRRLMRGLGIR